jgi:branched-chain amino acid transport system ATP-binding protein
MPLLEVKGLRAGYGSTEVVKGVSFGVESRDILGIIGSNGAGKSTILRCMSHLMEITSGEIRFQEKRIDSLPPSEIVRMGAIHIPERRGLFMKMSVLENLMVGAYLLKVKETKPLLEEVLTVFPRLKERRNQIAGTLSGGEQQMVTIGRGLMAKPKLLMLDEPTLGLAPLLIQDIGRTIMDIFQRGVSVLLAEQNAMLALSLSRRVCVLELGKIALEGDTKELQGNDYVRKAYLSR